MPGRFDFLDSGSPNDPASRKIVDTSSQIGRFLRAMALNAPYLPPNPHRPRAFGGKRAEGLKKEIPISNSHQ